MNLTVNVKNAPSEVNRPYIVVRFCDGELWYYGQYDDLERANEVALMLGMATVFDKSSYNAETLEQEPVVEPLERLAESAAKTAKVMERLNNGIIIPDNATNGDMIMALYPQEIEIIEGYVVFKLDDKKCRVSVEWWNAPYERGEKE